jgi:hypothetical protein
MSTSCLLRFTNPDYGQAAQVYKHYDGYPDRVIERLQQLRVILIATDCVRGPTYAAAQFITVEQFQRLVDATDQYKDGDDVNSLDWLTDRDQPRGLLGLGVLDSSDSVPPDVDYLYEVEVPNLSSPTKWLVRISSKQALSSPIPVSELYEAVSWSQTSDLTEL